MYGMVNRALESMVCKDYGEPTWEAIKQASGVDIEIFLNNQSYNDDVTYQLVGAASKVLNLPPETILEAFGVHWVLHTAVEGYGEMLRAAGKTLPEFMLNLPNFHNRVAMIFPNLRPPHFRCTDMTPTSLRLHYISHRQGLESFVVGLMHGLGQMFGTPVTVELLESRANGAAHEVFLISFSSPTQRAEMSEAAQSATIGLPPDLFRQAFPFFFVLDRNLKLRDLGPSLQRVVPTLVPGADFTLVFNMLRCDDVPMTFEGLFEALEAHVVLIEHIASGLQLRGNFVMPPGNSTLIFLASPWITDLKQMTTLGIGLNDFALGDPMVDLLMVRKEEQIARDDVSRLNKNLWCDSSRCSCCPTN